MKTFKEFISENTAATVDYSRFVVRTPGLGEYYVLELPAGVSSPPEGSKLDLDGVAVISLNPMTPDDWRRGRGGPAAISMEKRGINYSVNCLPVGHEWLEKWKNKWNKQGT